MLFFIRNLGHLMSNLSLTFIESFLKLIGYLLLTTDDVKTHRRFFRIKKKNVTLAVNFFSKPEKNFEWATFQSVFFLSKKKPTDISL